MIRLESTFEDEVYAFARVAGDDAIIVVLNFGAEARFARIQVPIERVFGSQKTVLAQDVFDGQQIELSVERGQQIVAALEPRAYKVFVVEK